VAEDAAAGGQREGRSATTMTVQFGIYINNRQPVLMGDRYPPTELLKAAELCEELGFHSVWVGDSPLAKPRLEPVTTLAAVAARTTRIRLGTSILQPHLRNPLWLAYSWATLDQLSGGRTILGVGIGSGSEQMLQRECDMAGIEKRRRGKHFEESIELVRRLWTEDEVSHQGRGYKLDRITLGVRPVQKPTPPIWIGAGLAGERRPTGAGGTDTFEFRGYAGPFERVARLGDGWFAGGFPAPEDCARIWPEIKQRARELGRDPQALTPIVSITTNVARDGEAAWAEARAMRQKYTGLPISPELVDRFLVGTPDVVIRKLNAFVAAGMRHFMINLQSEDLVGQIRTFAREVMPPFARA
jgi:alkanesulfonate monooxygenase SsuD/methylene tetrahydromethanopterin reductase-like flavin-dependent oxidoreductase (luciferase family)